MFSLLDRVRIVHVEHNDMPRNALGPTVSAAHQGAAALLREREEALSTTEPGLREGPKACVLRYQSGVNPLSRVRAVARRVIEVFSRGTTELRGFPCDAFVRGRARTEMEQPCASSAAWSYLPDQRGFRFSRNAFKPSC
jgi:hypothetical protein